MWIESINKYMETKYYKNNIDYLRTIPTDELQSIVHECSSLSNVLEYVGILPTRLNARSVLRDRIHSDSIDCSCFSENLKKKQETSVIVDDDLFVENSKYPGTVARERIKKNNLIEYKCSICGNEGFHFGTKLTLQLDHINGHNRDHRLENLRFLCPNCHTQQPTSYGANKPRRQIKRCACGNIMYDYSEKCITCANQNKGISNRTFNVSQEELENLIKEYPLTEIGKMFGVSDNAIRKRCKKLGIEMKSMRGHWRRVETGKV